MFPVERRIRKDIRAECNLYGDIVSREMDASNKQVRQAGVNGTRNTVKVNSLHALHHLGRSNCRFRTEGYVYVQLQVAPFALAVQFRK